MYRNFILFLFVFFILNTNGGYSQPNIIKSFTNIIVQKKPKQLPVIEVKNEEDKTIIFNDFSSKLTLINFWATWCAPCKKELPKLDSLYYQTSRDQLKIILINIEKKEFKDIENFLRSLSIRNLKSFFDDNLKLTRELGLRGIPITIIANSEKKEIARVIGDLDFTDPKFLKWVNSKYMMCVIDESGSVELAQGCKSDGKGGFTNCSTIQTSCSDIFNSRVTSHTNNIWKYWY